MSRLLECALQYAGRGWQVFPCRARSKAPATRHGFKDASSDSGVVTDWFATRPGANIAVACGNGLVVLDPDGPDGWKVLEELVRDCGSLPRTLTSQTARGVHAFYKSDLRSGQIRALDRQSGDDGGLDVQGEGKYVVLPPSVHPSGINYRWVVDAPIAELPEAHKAWLSGKMERKGNPKSGKTHKGAVHVPDPRPVWLQSVTIGERGDDVASRALVGMAEAVPVEDVEAAVALIPNPDVGWDAWNTMGMRIWAAVDGAEAGREVFGAWSAKSKKYDYDDVVARWEHYGRSPPSSTGFGSLVYEARLVEAGWTPPSRARKPDRANAQENSQALGEVNGHALGHHADALVPDIFLEKDSNNPLIKLNKQYAVIGDVGGKCMVLGWTTSKVDRSLKVPSFQTFRSFGERYASQYVMVENAKGEEEAKQVGPYWLKWTGRESYEGIELEPGGDRVLPGKVLNLWSGFSVEPRAPAEAPCAIRREAAANGAAEARGEVCGGRWDLMKRHILEVLAAGDVEAARYIVRFAAWAVQHPGERAEVALVLRGGKGTGKGTFANALRRIFGQHGLQIYTSKHLVGSFNGHLKNCLLLFADEAFWAGDRQGESALKAMLTEPVMMIEHKGLDAIQWRNRLHVIMAANADWVVPASHDERRYCVFDVSDHRANDRAYFKALVAETDNGGLSAMLYDLLAMQLGEWHPREIVRNEALRAQKARSLDGLHAWLENVLQVGQLPCGVGIRPKVLHEASASDLLEDAKSYSSRYVSVNKSTLADFLKKWEVARKKRENASYWIFPELNVLKQRWERKFGKWEWEAENVEWS